MFKQLILTIFSLFIGTGLMAQCNGLFPIEQGTVFELSNYNRKDKLQSVAAHRVVSMTAEGDGTVEATIQSEIIDEDGDQLTTGTYEVRCEAGVIYLDMSSLMNPALTQISANMEATVTGDQLVLPANLEVGQSLPDATTTLEVGTGGMKIMSISITQTNREVVANEKITTPAGTFDCFEINYDMDMKTIFSKTYHVKEWYAEGVGLVRSETYRKKDKLESYTVLTAFSK